MGHLVITIGCEYGAKGNAIGRKIAEDLGIKFYDRDLVDQIIEEVGIPKDIMNRVEEGGTIAGKGAEGDVRGSFSKYADLTERAIHVQKQIIRKLAEKEACVIIGRCRIEGSCASGIMSSGATSLASQILAPAGERTSSNSYWKRTRR